MLSYRLEIGLRRHRLRATNRDAPLTRGSALRDGSLQSSMRLSFETPAWRLKRPLAELMPGKAQLFLAASLAAYCTLQWGARLWAGGVALRDGSLRSA